MRKAHFLILGLILSIGLFFRSYQFVERFEFAHDGDLYSWIVKDIVVNHHFRLIGQLTSAPGIFIGGLFYYLLIPFFGVTKMDPIGVMFFTIIIGLSTITSYYFVLSKLFRIEVGLISAFLYATLLATVNSDRWVVPTITTNLWIIWYFFTVIKIARGDYRVLPLLGILTGLIWHIHIALIPALIAVPAAFFASKKLPTKKQTFLFLVALFTTSLPLILFETRHNFQQTISLLNNFVLKNESTATGLYKSQLVLEMITKNINTLFFMPQSFKFTKNFLLVPLILLSALLLVKRKFFSFKELFSLYVWLLGVIVFFSLSSSPISEYYFANIEIIFLAIASLFFYLAYKKSQMGKILVLSVLGLVLVKNAYFLINQDYYHKGYTEKKKLVEYIVKDMKARGFPCIGISYITTPGENVGFRYLFYLNNVHLIHPSLDIPVYNIVIPDELSPEVTQKFGHIGIIPPTTIPPKEVVQKSCQTPNTNLTDPMFGFVN